MLNNEEAANARAASRLEQLQRLSVRATGRSGNARLQPGRVITLEGASDELFNTDFLIVSVTHELRQAAPGAPGGQPYANRVLMVPFGPRRIRAVTHLDVDDHGIERALEALSRVLE